jgi:exodeoxyribonuclease-5
MTTNLPTLSDDQAEAFDRITEALANAGVDIVDGSTLPAGKAGLGDDNVFAVTGKAGSGKTVLLAALSRACEEAGVGLISGDYEPRKTSDKRTLAILAPTNKAASVVRLCGVPATTIHRFLYTPVYDPEYDMIAEWLMPMAKATAPRSMARP